MQADAVVFGESDEWGEVEIRELRAKHVVKLREFLRAANVARSVVQDAIWGDKFEYGLAPGLVPDFFEPAMDEHFILFESGKRLGSGRHRFLLGKGVGEYTGKHRKRNVGLWVRRR